MPDKLYVGSTINYNARVKSHLNKLKNNLHPNSRLTAHYQEHGAEDFQFSILENVPDKSLLLAREQHYLDSLNPAFNICKLAGTSLGVIRSKEFREKVSKAKKGAKHSPEANAAKSLRQKGLKNALGFRHTEESRKRISENSAKIHPIYQLTPDGKIVKEWPGIKIAAKELNVHYQSICACLNGRIKQTGGFYFKSKKHDTNS